MANPDLNVSLGLVTRDFERSLKRVEKRMKSFARDLDRTGASITQSLSAPLALAGGAALNSAAKFEQLEKALIAVTGSSDEANAQLLRLQKIAEAPGIGFNQAVAASLQLQGLGVEAGRAEEAIRQVANVVAASGGGANEFAGVVRQLNQIQAKNRVLQEDLNILLENAPVVGEVLQQAFGAKTAEEIRARGIDGEEFFDRLVEGLSKVERVETGLFNTFENFGIQLEFTLARVGKAIDETFDIQGILNRTIRVIENMTEVFVNLDDATRRNLLRFTALVVVSGPLLQIGSRLVTVYSGVFAVFRTGVVAAANLAARIELFAKGSAATGPIVAGLGKKVKSVTAAFRALSVAQKATVVGLIASVAALAVQQFLKYRKAIRDTSDAIREKDNLLRKSQAIADQEIAKVDSLVAVIEDETNSQKDRVTALKQLQQLYPDTFANLDTQRIKVDKVRMARDELRKSIVKQARAEAAQDKIVEINSKILELQEKQLKVATKLREEQLRVGDASDGLAQSNSNLGNSVGGRVLPRLELLQGQYKGIAEEIGGLLEVQDRLSAFANEDISGPNIQSPSIDAPEVPQPVGQISDPFAGLGVSMDLPGEFLPIRISKPEDLPKTLDELAGQVAEIQLPFLEDVDGEIIDKIITIGDAIKTNIGEPLFNVATQLITGVANAFGTLFENIIDGSQNAFQSFANALKDVAKQLVSTIIKAAVLATLFTVIFPGSIGAAGFGALFKKGLGGGLQGILGLELADGGIVTGPTPALIGEAGPEAIIPLSEMDKLLGSNQVEVIGRVSGEDIYFSNRRAGQRLSRSIG